MAINKEELLFKKVFAGKASTDNNTAYFSETAVTNARPSVFSKDIWSEAHLIPDSGIGHITGSVNPGDFTASGVVKYYSASGFTAVAGADAGYSAGIKDWIPFNFGDGTTFNYVLLKNNGDRLFPGDAANNWTFDTEAGVLIFHDGNPSGVSSTTPPSMSAYVYIGNKLSDGIGDSTTSITGSLLGTASVAVSSSHSLTASSLENNLNYHLNSLTASSGIFFTSSAPNNQYSIDYAKVLKANGFPEPTSGSLTISASSVRIDGDLTATGSVTLGGALSFNGFNFVESTISTSTGSTFFGSGSTGSAVQSTSHQFTGSVLITGSNLTLTDGVLTIPNNAGNGIINVASVLASTATATNVVTNGVFNAFSSSYSQSVVDFLTTSESLANEVNTFESFSSSFSQSVVDFNTNLGIFNSFSQSYSQSVQDFLAASESFESSVASFTSFSSSFSSSIDNLTLGSASVASAIKIDGFNGVEFQQNVIIKGNLDVQGTTTTINTQDLSVEDRFIILGSGSAGMDDDLDVGIIFDSGSQDGSGMALYYDASENRLNVGKNINNVDFTASADGSSGTAFSVGNRGNNSGNVVTVKTAQPTPPSLSSSSFGEGEMYIDNNNNIYIYVED